MSIENNKWEVMNGGDSISGVICQQVCHVAPNKPCTLNNFGKKSDLIGWGFKYISKILFMIFLFEI